MLTSMAANIFKGRRRGVKPYRRHAVVRNTAEIIEWLGVSTIDEAEQTMKAKGIGYHKDAMGELWTSGVVRQELSDLMVPVVADWADGACNSGGGSLGAA